MPPRALPPAVALLTRGFVVNLVFPIGLVWSGTRLQESLLGSRLPIWLQVLLQVASVPAFAAAQIWYRLWDIDRRAARSGGTLPPRYVGHGIGDLGTLRDFMEIHWKTGYLGDGLSDVLTSHGPTFDLRILWDHTIVTTDANIIKTVLATDFPNWVKGDVFQEYMYSVLGTGVFNSDGEMWKFHRSMTRPFFSKDRITHFEMFDRHAETTISKIKERIHAGEAIEFQDLISRFTLDSATEFLFGSCVNSLHSDLPYPYSSSSPFKRRDSEPSKAEAFAKAFQAAQDIMGTRARVGWVWPLMELSGDKSAEHMRVVDDYLNPILQSAIERNQQNKNAGLEKKSIDEVDEDETLLDHLVKFTEDPVVLHDEILNIMIAGRDTTAITLTALVYLLTQHPETLQRLRKEILEVVGPTRRPTYDDIREMKFLRAVINETLRLFPAVPFDVRYPLKDVLVPNSADPSKPFFVPKMTSLSYCVWLMHRRTDYWGPDAEEFDPDRFLDERVHKYLTPNPFIFLPFNAGPRICLGQQFAYNEMSFFMVRLLQNFSDITLDLAARAPDAQIPTEWAQFPGRKGKEKVWPKAHLTLYMHGGVWVKMREAEPAEII